ncbi:hypothetical protein SUN_0985 [Sulfurovum sp. NBC37-1]|nr:hypothetical protein SUN_0985 [Sulfurovum sp. NBC37-1]
MPDAQMPSFDIYDVTIEFDHIVVIVKVYIDLMYLTVKTPEFFDETRRSKDEETCTTHQHERCHDEMYGEEEDHGEDVFGHTVFEPAETKSLREEDMLQVTHVPGREEEKFVIHFKEVVFLCSGCFAFGEPVEYGTDLWSPVYPGDYVEGTGRVENEGGHTVQAVNLVQYTPDGSVSAVDDDVVILLEIMVLAQFGGLDGSDGQCVVGKLFPYREYLHHRSCRLVGYNYSHEN